MFDGHETPPIEAEAIESFTETDQQHLNLLAIFHYVLAGLNLLGICGGVVYIVLGNLFLTGTMTPDDPSMSEGQTRAIGWLMIGLGGCVSVFVVAMSVLYLFAGLSLQRQRRRMLCLIVAGVNCLSVPLGTVLGIFTFIVLFRPSVRARFEAVKSARERGVDPLTPASVP